MTTTEIHTLRADAAEWYSAALAGVAEALPSSLALAERLLAPIAGEVWMGSLTLHGKTEPGSLERSTRRVPDPVRAAVFLRDGFTCTYCGGRTIPRCVLVAISDVFPEAFPYYLHYRRGTVHPAFWALAPEADHVLAHANGGSSDLDNLTTLHAMCNTRKSSLEVGALPSPAAIPPDADAEWDGLISRYADIVIAGNDLGHRHARPTYHLDWLRHFGLVADVARVRAVAAKQ